MLRDPIIEPLALASLRRFRLLDVRELAVFEAGHPARAVRVPIEAWEAAAKTSETSLENVAYWQGAIADLGVHNQVPAVVYDDGRMTEAARVWFILQYFGAAALILNGGLPALEGDEALLAGAERSETATAFVARPASGSVGLVDRTWLRSELNGDIRIFDARTVGEYEGEDLRRNQRGGHLPGARLIPHANLLDGGRLLSSNALRGLLGKAGFQSGDHVVTHCDGGGRAALAAAAAVRAGYENVRAYYLSFADWANDESCPIVRD